MNQIQECTWRVLPCVIIALLGSYPSAGWGQLPDLAPSELAECMRLGARSLESLSVEQHVVHSGTPQGVARPAAEDGKGGEIREWRDAYKMKQHFLLQYSRFTPVVPEVAGGTRQAAYNGEFFTWQQGMQGAIEPTPSGPYGGMSYLFLRLLYYPSEKEAYADYLIPPSIWRVEFEDPTIFEGNPCYVLSLHAQPPGKKQEGPTLSLCWRLTVCPRFGFATVGRQVTLTSAGNSELRQRTEFRKFTEVATGMWLPLECESWSRHNDGPLAITYHYDSVNQPIDDAEFVVRFTPGATVSDTRTGTRVTKVAE